MKHLTNPKRYTRANGAFGIVTLQHHFVYRRSRERWLLSPPTEEFWGEPMVFQGRHLTLHYPARDKEIKRWPYPKK